MLSERQRSLAAAEDEVDDDADKGEEQQEHQPQHLGDEGLGGHENLKASDEEEDEVEDAEDGGEHGWVRRAESRAMSDEW